MAPSPFYPQRPFRWEGQNFTLPVCEDINDLMKLKPLALESRFLAFENNRRPIVSEKIRSCLCTLFVQYALAAERYKAWSPHKRKELVDSFKTSPEWDAVLRRHNVESSSQRRNLPPASLVPPQAPTGPAASRDQRPDSKGHTTGLAHRLSTTAWSKLASENEQTSDPRLKNQASRPANAIKGWEMPDPPTWELRDMTFQKFVDIFLEKNRVDATKGYTPWGTVLSFFGDYVKQQWPLVSNSVVLKHLAYALTHTKQKAQIPPSLLERHLRRLDADILEESRNNAARPTNSTQKRSEENLSLRQNAEAQYPDAGVARETKVELGKRAREEGNDSPKSPNAKQIKLEPRSSEEPPLLANPTTYPRPASQPTKEAGPEMEMDGNTRALLEPPSDRGVLPETADPGFGAVKGNGLSAAAVEDNRQALNPTLGRMKVGSGSASTFAPYPKDERRRAPSPAPSAIAWLQANIPDGLRGRQSDTPAASDVVPPLAASNVAPEEATYPATGVLPPSVQALAKVPGGVLARGPTLKSLVNLDIIINGVLEDLSSMVAEAKGPGTTEPLTPDQQNMLGKLIWSHKSALKELNSLQKAADDGWFG